jgi:hypothetical protein
VRIGQHAMPRDILGVLVTNGRSQIPDADVAPQASRGRHHVHLAGMTRAPPSLRTLNGAEAMDRFKVTAVGE